jgi:hypothetical protein
MVCIVLQFVLYNALNNSFFLVSRNCFIDCRLLFNTLETFLMLYMKSCGGLYLLPVLRRTLYTSIMARLYMYRNLRRIC